MYMINDIDSSYSHILSTYTIMFHALIPYRGTTIPFHPPKRRTPEKKNTSWVVKPIWKLWIIGQSGSKLDRFPIFLGVNMKHVLKPAPPKWHRVKTCSPQETRWPSWHVKCSLHRTLLVPGSRLGAWTTSWGTLVGCLVGCWGSGHQSPAPQHNLHLKEARIWTTMNDLKRSTWNWKCCWWQKSGEKTSWGKGSLSQYLQGFIIHPRWLFGISEPSTVG